jgi:hypothetical protein
MSNQLPRFARSLKNAQFRASPYETLAQYNENITNLRAEYKANTREATLQKRRAAALVR